MRDVLALYAAHWRRGWWAWLLMLVLNLVTVVLVLPLALLFADRSGLYIGSVLVVWLLAGAPIWGMVYESFARNSVRLVAEPPRRATFEG